MGLTHTSHTVLDLRQILKNFSLEEKWTPRLHSPSPPWNLESKALFLDSLIQGFPVGSLVLSAQYVGSPGLQVLDGQQRLLTLAGGAD